ncbi:MAG: TlpA disulfide reductase family protein [Actinomycetota bacterium]|nr:TlpA disulfide reductase family protein [Actinomycetota bacterium]
MEDNADMNEIEEELIIVERNRNPKVVLGFFSIIILIAAIIMGVTLSDSNDSSTNTAINETLPAQPEIIPDAQDPIEIEANENAVQSSLEQGEVIILGDPIPVDPEIGYTAPSFKAQLNTGSELVTIDPADGTVRLIGFFAHWCPHCQREVPRVSKWLEENGVPTEIEILAVSTAVREGTPNYPPSEWFTKERWPTDIFVDNEDNDLAAAYGLAGFPYWVLVDATGRIAHRSSGELTEEQFGYLVDLAMSLVPKLA